MYTLGIVIITYTSEYVGKIIFYNVSHAYSINASYVYLFNCGNRDNKNTYDLLYRLTFKLWILDKFMRLNDCHYFSLAWCSLDGKWNNLY